MSFYVGKDFKIDTYDELVRVYRFINEKCNSDTNFLASYISKYYKLPLIFRFNNDGYRNTSHQNVVDPYTSFKEWSENEPDGKEYYERYKKALRSKVLIEPKKYPEYFL